jgi:hypothetical protein
LCSVYIHGFCFNNIIILFVWNREPTNRVRKYCESKQFSLSQALLRNNTAYDHFKNMLAVLESNEEAEAAGKEMQQHRVHRAAVECHTVLFCCLDTVNGIDKEVQELKEKMYALSEHDGESFNFSSTNSVHFFPAQFHPYFGNANATPVRAAYAPKKLKKRKVTSKKKVSGKDQMAEKDDGDGDGDGDDVFLTQGSEDGDIDDHEDDDEAKKRNRSQNQEDDAMFEYSSDDEKKKNASPSRRKKKDYNKQAVLELIAEWLAGEIDEEKTADEWVDTAVEVVTSVTSEQVLRSGAEEDATPDGEHEATADYTSGGESPADLDLTISCLAEWLEECLHKQKENDNKSAKQWIKAAQQCVASQTKKKKYKKKTFKKKELQPYPCTQCNKMYRGKGKTLPTRLGLASHNKNNNNNNKSTKEVHFLQIQKPQHYKFSNGRGSNDKLFCSWECTRLWNEEHTPVLYRYETEQLIRIAAGKFKLTK